MRATPGEYSRSTSGYMVLLQNSYSANTWYYKCFSGAVGGFREDRTITKIVTEAEI